ncbi:zinc finger protein ZFP2 [Plutella xylostella]|uniref:zinc finger protein ZFP2 n=1 Tax=Plutella xylostella TaxID=51655 RepID=UPI0020329357|nr:zinc finger protein ZFP2 [Plutella xylostella]
MMYDPPDYPYKDLPETLQDTNEDLLFTNACSTFPSNPTPEVTKTQSFEPQLPNHIEQYYSTELLPGNGNDNAELLVIQSENLLYYEPTLLDDNTVNQFLLLPENNNSNVTKDGEEESGPDLLSLQSCVLCHEIFTTEADLLDHSISMHASDNAIDQNLNLREPPVFNDASVSAGCETVGSDTNTPVEDWLVCSACQRVLSTSQEIDTSEPLCCMDIAGKCTVVRRQLETMYVCDYCSGLFADGESLESHRTCCMINEVSYQETEDIVTNNIQGSPEYLMPCFTCESCHNLFNTAEELTRHLSNCQAHPVTRRGKHTFSSNSSSKMWNCGSCNQLFATARELYRHKRGEDRPPGAPLTAYVCEECDKVLGSMCALHTHRKMHKVTKPGYPCRICGRRFNQSGHLAIHMRMHTGERPYPCDLCSKAFKVKVERDDHRRTHTGERPFACAACPKTFTAAARLREHARIHTDQRPYRCDICGAAFRRPYARTVHTLIHTGEKPHECDVCGTAFRRSGDMWKHKRTIHGTQLPEDGKPH